jgi:hypothetical protein
MTTETTGTTTTKQQLGRREDKDDANDEEGQGKADNDDAGHDADTGHDAVTRRMLEREREGRDDFYKSKDSLNNDNFISPFGSQFKLLAVVPHRLLSCCPCNPLPYHPSPLLSRHRLSPRAAPLSCCLVVASPPLSLRHHLSCAG